MFILKALYFGFEGLRKNYTHQLETLCSYAQLSLGDVPTIIGEVGVPFDINGAKALRDGNYDQQAQLYSALVEAMERNGLNFTLWNYNPDNTTAFGDGWNMEVSAMLGLQGTEAGLTPYRNSAGLLCHVQRQGCT